MYLPVTVIAFLAGAVPASAALAARHSKEFPLRYECDVAPALAGWTLTPASTGGLGGLPSNGWLPFDTSPAQVTAFRNTPWNLASDQPYTFEIRLRTPRVGQIRLDVDDGDAFRNTLIVSSSGLLWNVSGVPTSIAPNSPNTMHVVRVAGWSEQGQRMAQVWQDGRSVYGPAASTTASPKTGSATVWGDPSNTEEAETEIDYLRMTAGAAFAPFVPRLEIRNVPGAVTLTWPTAPGAVYQPQAGSDLTEAGWQNLGGFIPATQTTGSFSDGPLGGTARFYRVREIVEGAIDQPWSPGPPPVCTGLPSFSCVGGNCLELVPFEPVLGSGYENYPINGETPANQYRSYVRREVRMAIQHAAARVECMARHWPFGTNRPLGLGDMSEANGSIPGTSVGSPGHPAGTHEDGRDIDIAYYQLDAADNRLRAICESRLNGVNQSHCVAPPNTLDVWRTALFVGTLMENPRLRVIGVDGQVGPLLVQAVARLVEAGWLPPTVPAILQQKLAYETTDGGLGWFQFHYQFMHVSFKN